MGDAAPSPPEEVGAGCLEQGRRWRRLSRPPYTASVLLFSPSGHKLPSEVLSGWIQKAITYLRPSNKNAWSPQVAALGVGEGDGARGWKSLASPSAQQRRAVSVRPHLPH